MSEAEHVEYFRKRATDERELARAAPAEAIARIHLQMAEYYETLIDPAGAGDDLGMVLKSPVRRAIGAWNGA